MKDTPSTYSALNTAQMSTQMIPDALDRIESIGEARYRLISLLDNELFDDLSKHNPYWDSKYENECDKLYTIRCALKWLEEELLEIVSVLNKENHG